MSCRRRPSWALIAILENDIRETAQLVGLEPEEILEREPGLLEQAKAQCRKFCCRSAMC